MIARHYELYPSPDETELCNTAKDGFGLGVTLLKLYDIPLSWQNDYQVYQNSNYTDAAAMKRCAALMGPPSDEQLAQAGVPPYMQTIIKGLLNTDFEARMTPLHAQALIQQNGG